MSHQDRKSRLNHQDLTQAVKSLIPESTLSGIRFRDDSKWTPFSFVLNCMFWALSTESTLCDRFEHSQEILARILPIPEQMGKTYRAFIKLMRRWQSAFVPRLKKRLQEVTLQVSEQVAGFHVYAVDGSRFDTWQTEANQAALGGRNEKNQNLKKRTKGKPEGKRKQRKQTEASKASKRDNAKIWLTTLWETSTGLPWEYRLGPGYSSERHHFLEMLSGLPTNSLVTADAGFVGYEFWRTTVESGHDFVIRVGANVTLIKDLYQAERRGNMVYCWTDEAAKSGKQPVELRLVKVTRTVKRTKRVKGKKVTVKKQQTIYLVTTVMDSSRLSDSQIRQIYKRRWGVEVYYRHIKQTFKRAKMLSRTPDNAVNELEWNILALWTLMAYAATRQVKRGRSPLRVSVAGVLRAVRKIFRILDLRTRKNRSLAELVDNALLDTFNRKSEKSKRKPKTKKKRKPIGDPIIMEATKEQRKLAREILSRETEGRNAA